MVLLRRRRRQRLPRSRGLPGGRLRQLLRAQHQGLCQARRAHRRRGPHPRIRRARLRHRDERAARAGGAGAAGRHAAQHDVDARPLARVEAVRGLERSGRAAHAARAAAAGAAPAGDRRRRRLDACRRRRRCSASPRTGSCRSANAFRFQDTFDNHHPLYAGDVGHRHQSEAGRARASESDLVLAIGPRLGEMTTGGYTLLEAPAIRSRSWCTSTRAPRS